ncbi:3-deoxy-D-manno-octulosonic acid kinase [Kaarinaea lacus]
MTTKTLEKNNNVFIYNNELISDVAEGLFDPNYHRRQGTMQGEALGRGTTHFIRVNDHRCVLRHYRRGGMAAALLNDQYFWTGLEQTRPWIEWNLLDTLATQGLPVPIPMAARVVKRIMYYTADLVTLRIPNSKSLTEHLRQRELPKEQWQAVGETVRAFHDRGVYHADLNAHNIMLNDEGKVFLIDFDKGQIRDTQGKWQQEIIERLKRSLTKLASRISPFYFDEWRWQQFMDGYGH